MARAACHATTTAVHERLFLTPYLLEKTEKYFWAIYTAVHVANCRKQHLSASNPVLYNASGSSCSSSSCSEVEPVLRYEHVHVVLFVCLMRC